MSDDDDAGRLRLRMVGIIGLALFGALFARLWYLQVLDAEELRLEARANIIRVIPEQGPRGRILDRSGKVLVENALVNVVTVDKQEYEAADLSDDEEAAMALRLAVAISRTGSLTKVVGIVDALDDPEYGAFDAVPVAVDVDPSLLVFVGERPDDFPGVEIVQRSVRTYPYGQLAAHVLGYVGAITQSELDAGNGDIDPDLEDAKTYRPSDEIGKTGIERIFESELRGVPGRRVLEVDNEGRVIREIERDSVEPKPGNDVWLTIDIDVQALVERELASGLERAGEQKPEQGSPAFVAAAGSAVALDPRDGDVIAMASYPTYDPADFVNGISTRQFELLTNEANYSPILNRAIQGAYAPGSTFKVVTAYAALTQDVYGPAPSPMSSPEQSVPDVGKYTLPRCDEESGTCVFSSPFNGERSVNLEEAITVSSDVYFYRLAAEGFFPRPRGPDEGIQEAARSFGLGSPTGIPLPFERAGVVPDRDYFDRQFDAGVFLRNGDQWFAGDTINLSIGQGDLLVTPTQLVNIYATFANGGRVHQPNIVRRVTTPENDVVVEFGPRVVREIDLPDDVRQPIVNGLLEVPRRGSIYDGTAYEAFGPPEVGGVDFPVNVWPVAAKTGTAQKTGKADSALFAAFGPVDHPKRSLVGGYEPEIAIAIVLEEAGFGGDVAAPVVARVLDEIANDTVPDAITRATLEEFEREQERQAAIDAGLIDPDTGESIEGGLVDVETGLPIDPATGEPIVVEP